MLRSGRRKTRLWKRVDSHTPADLRQCIGPPMRHAYITFIRRLVFPTEPFTHYRRQYITDTSTAWGQLIRKIAAWTLLPLGKCHVPIHSLRPLFTESLVASNSILSVIPYINLSVLVWGQNVWRGVCLRGKCASAPNRENWSRFVKS